MTLLGCLDFPGFAIPQEKERERERQGKGEREKERKRERERRSMTRREKSACLAERVSAFGTPRTTLPYETRNIMLFSGRVQRTAKSKLVYPQSLAVSLLLLLHGGLGLTMSEQGHLMVCHSAKAT